MPCTPQNLESCRRWRERNREKKNAKSRQRYAGEKRSDLEFLERQRAAGRKYRATDHGKAVGKARYERNREKHKIMRLKSHLKTKFGLTIADYDALLAAQGGACAICRADSDLCVDHDHATGKVRGILCRKCNVLLGMVGDSVDRLASATSYLVSRVPRLEVA